MITLPNRSGWMVSYYTGGVTPRGNKKKKDFIFKTKEEADKKAQELANEGFEIEFVTECIY
jgi:hypothetical protein